MPFFAISERTIHQTKSCLLDPNVGLLVPAEACLPDVDILRVLELQGLAIARLSPIVNEPHVVSCVERALREGAEDRLFRGPQAVHCCLLGEGQRGAQVEIEKADVDFGQAQSIQLLQHRRGVANCRRFNEDLRLDHGHPMCHLMGVVIGHITAYDAHR